MERYRALALYIVDRLAEASTWAAIAGLLVMLHVNVTDPQWQLITKWGVVIAAAIGASLREGKFDLTVLQNAAAPLAPYQPPPAPPIADPPPPAPSPAAVIAGRVGASSPMIALTLAVGLGLAACSSIATPSTPRQVYAETETALTALIETATVARRSHLLSADLDASLDRAIHTAGDLVIAARGAITKGDATAALQSLQQAAAVIAAAQQQVPK